MNERERRAHVEGAVAALHDVCQVALAERACTTDEPCSERRGYDAIGDVGIIASTVDGKGGFWSLHTGDPEHAVLVTHCPWCGGRLS